jgi:hypothetical protein
MQASNSVKIGNTGIAVYTFTLIVFVV